MDEGPVGSGLLVERHNQGNGNGNGNGNISGNGNGNGNGNGQRLRIPMERRYYSPPPATLVYPPEVHEYNERFTHLLENIKKRHDPTVTTVAQGVLEWKRKRKTGRIGVPIQEWLDRFYMSRIGIRFLIGQRESMTMPREKRDRVENIKG